MISPIAAALSSFVAVALHFSLGCPFFKLPGCRNCGVVLTAVGRDGVVSHVLFSRGLVAFVQGDALLSMRHSHVQRSRRPVDVLAFANRVSVTMQNG